MYNLIVTFSKSGTKLPLYESAVELECLKQRHQFYLFHKKAMAELQPYTAVSNALAPDGRGLIFHQDTRRQYAKPRIFMELEIKERPEPEPEIEEYKENHREDYIATEHTEVGADGYKR